MNEGVVAYLAKGRYARKRREILENYAPKMLEALKREDSLEEHLAVVQTMVSDYVRQAAKHFKRTDSYLNAAPQEARKFLDAAVMIAEDNAYRMWIANVSEDNEYTSGGDNASISDRNECDEISYIRSRKQIIMIKSCKL